jgi:hypothetical protein
MTSQAGHLVTTIFPILLSTTPGVVAYWMVRFSRTMTGNVKVDAADIGLQQFEKAGGKS